LTQALAENVAGVEFEVTKIEVQAFNNMFCPAGYTEMTGQSYDSKWVTYAPDIDACAEACDLQTPNHGNEPARKCDSFQFSEIVNSNGWGQCWRFEPAQPTDTSSNRQHFVFCSRETTPDQPSSSKTLSKIGDGYCTSGGQKVGLLGYTLATKADECLANCEADSDCVGAMTAYDYYCQLYKSTDVHTMTGAIDGVANYRTEWSCYAKQDPHSVVLMEFQANGISAASFPSVEADMKATLASELGVNPGQIELSLTPFRRRLSSTDSVTIYTKVNAMEEDLEKINEVKDDSSSLTQALAENVAGVEFEVTKTEVQAFTAPPSSEPEEAVKESDENTVSMTTFAIVVAILAVLLIVAAIYILCNSSSDSEKESPDAEYGKRLPVSTAEDLEMTGLPKTLEDNSSFGGGLTFGEGVSTNTGLNNEWQNASNVL